MTFKISRESVEHFYKGEVPLKFFQEIIKDSVYFSIFKRKKIKFEN